MIIKMAYYRPQTRFLKNFAAERASMVFAALRKVALSSDLNFHDLRSRKLEVLLVVRSNNFLLEKLKACFSKDESKIPSRE